MAWEIACPVFCIATLPLAFNQLKKSGLVGHLELFQCCFSFKEEESSRPSVKHPFLPLELGKKKKMSLNAFQCPMLDVNSYRRRQTPLPPGAKVLQVAREKVGLRGSPGPWHLPGGARCPPACCAFKVRWGRAVGAGLEAGLGVAAAPGAALSSPGRPSRGPRPSHIEWAPTRRGRAHCRGPGHGQLPAGRLCGGLDRR